MDKPVIGIPELQSHSVSDALALLDSVTKKSELESSDNPSAQSSLGIFVITNSILILKVCIFTSTKKVLEQRYLEMIAALI